MTARRSRPRRIRITFRIAYKYSGDRYIGKLLKEVGVVCQGRTLKELEKNLLDAYRRQRVVRRNRLRRLIPIPASALRRLRSRARELRARPSADSAAARKAAQARWSKRKR